MSWKKEVKPSASICPQTFCFIWSEKAKSCGRAFGLCKREDSINGKQDCYEPCEPELKKADLPWFYFISSEEILVEDLREKYKIESAEFWGKN